MRTSMRAVLFVSVALAFACQRREHLRSGFGVENRTFFDRQAAAAGSGSAHGLDSEEAAAVQQRYRQSIGDPRSRAASPGDPRSSVMILQEDRRAPAKSRP